MGINQPKGASIYVHVWPLAYIQLLSKPYKNEVILRGQKISLKCCQPLKLVMYIGRGFRSFHTGNMGSVGQRAAKLLAVKVGGLKNKCANWPGPT